MTSKFLFALATALVLSADVAWACEYCLGTGTANDSTIRALVFSMASLLSMITFVGVGIGMFFYKVHKRGRMLAPSSGGVAISNSGSLVSESHRSDNQ
ncbi:MAG: hypothetical protein OXM02_04270 [Bacteroidota bacterium]|nr:hypothetical protein [Bacteroidota bacterium]MDE2833717.1 hypothetical protein [Bacteroidota bacterium]MDE2957302.1 hypothetical protein [Bacteroidota bacterium]